VEGLLDVCNGKLDTTMQPTSTPSLQPVLPALPIAFAAYNVIDALKNMYSMKAQCAPVVPENTVSRTIMSATNALGQPESVLRSFQVIWESHRMI
jgi:hypothetical protein